MNWQKGDLPKKSTYMWIQWFDKRWMDAPLIELAHFHPNHGLQFFGDEPDWSMEKVISTDFLYLPIETPEGGIA